MLSAATDAVDQIVTTHMEDFNIATAGNLRELRATLTTADLHTLAVEALKLSTPAASLTFARCLELLASRMGREAFVSECAAIHDDATATLRRQKIM